MANTLGIHRLLGTFYCAVMEELSQDLKRIFDYQLMMAYLNISMLNSCTLCCSVFLFCLKCVVNNFWNQIRWIILSFLVVLCFKFLKLLLFLFFLAVLRLRFVCLVRILNETYRDIFVYSVALETCYQGYLYLCM